MASHTPGPWLIRHGENREKTGKYYTLISIESQHFAEDIAGIHHPEDVDEANARLIAAAPLLLECLVNLVERAEAADEELTGPADRQYFSAELLAKCRAATQKALGKSD